MGTAVPRTKTAFAMAKTGEFDSFVIDIVPVSKCHTIPASTDWSVLTWLEGSINVGIWNLCLDQHAADIFTCREYAAYAVT
jgi:hypothetical protein